MKKAKKVKLEIKMIKYINFSNVFKLHVKEKSYLVVKIFCDELQNS